MRLAVIIAGFRPEGVLQTVKDLDNQTYKDFDVILVNDNSEGLREIMFDICKDRPNYHWIDVGSRLGYYGAFSRNMGVMASFNYLPERVKKNDSDFWVTFHDDDNLWLPNHIEEFVKSHKEKPEATMIGCDIEMRSKINPDYSHNLNNQLAGQNTDLGAWFYKKELFEEYGYFPASLRFKISYDWELIKKFSENEGDSKIVVNHYRPCSFIFFSKKRK